VNEVNRIDGRLQTSTDAVPCAVTASYEDYVNSNPQGFFNREETIPAKNVPIPPGLLTL
jgi:hypothetical protein